MSSVLKCGVCGAQARGVHFGGVSCDPCKAFFRRSVQTGMWQAFHCTASTITVTVTAAYPAIANGNANTKGCHQNYRSCQACRYRRCEEIGMSPSLVMSEEGRKALMARRLEKRRKQLVLLQEEDQQRREVRKESGSDQENEEWREKGKREMDVYEVKKEEEEEFEEAKNEEKVNMQCSTMADLPRVILADSSITGVLVRLLRKSLVFPEFREDAAMLRQKTGLAPVEEGNAGQLTARTEHLIFALCKGLGRFYTLTMPLLELGCRQQQEEAVLKHAVAMGVILYASHQFQGQGEWWPRRALSPSCWWPRVTLREVFCLLPAAHHRTAFAAFMRKNCSFFADEVVTAISLVAALCDAQRCSTSADGGGLKQEPGAVFTAEDGLEREEKEKEKGKEEEVRRRDLCLGLLHRYLTHKHQDAAIASSITTELISCLEEVRGLASCLTTATKDDLLYAATSHTTHHAPHHAPGRPEDSEDETVVKGDPETAYEEETFNCLNACKGAQGGEATSASIEVKGGSRLHLRLPGNYRLEHQWQDDQSATFHLTFTTRPPRPSSRHGKKKKKEGSSSQLLGYVTVTILLLCLVLVLTWDFAVFLPSFGYKPPRDVTPRDSNFTREQLIARGRILS
ncbi:hypothetical protein O3P69_005787 [Scylla paramamosain]|uniref:Nuclear receptor domain-containing protein n=1 Tax=Scylla paramamosain TaxID=85552 RepID=A0AAW0U823_SCYPA